jgi:hypothetical protein
VKREITKIAREQNTTKTRMEKRGKGSKEKNEGKNMEVDT